MRFTLLSHCHTDIAVASRAEAWIETTILRNMSSSTMSPPARRRGSKHGDVSGSRNGRTSPPARRRGSKQDASDAHGAHDRRLPRGGVDRNKDVAGLKLPQHGRLPRGGVDRNIMTTTCAKAERVASRAEAWIETSSGRTSGPPSGSPPARRRGSKRLSPRDVEAGPLSPPARRRGSKHGPLCAGHGHDGRLPRGGVDRNFSYFPDPEGKAVVASRAEAWIETGRAAWFVPVHRVASRAEAWIETTECAS